MILSQKAVKFDKTAVLTPEISRRAEVGWLAFLIATTGLLLIWRWVGFQGGDDKVYVDAAEAWLESFPVLADNHWGLRYPVVLPMAGIFFVFGKSEVTLPLANLLYFLVFLIVGYYFVRRWFGTSAAVIWVVLLICLPGYLVLGTYVNADMPELLFVSGSLWFYLFARCDEGGTTSLIVSGLCLGLAFLVRETAIGLALLYGALFLVSPGIRRRDYLVIGFAAFIVVGGQMVYFTAMTGDPFYRQEISASHDRVDRHLEVQRVTTGDDLIDSEGALSVNVFLDPVLVLFVSQKYGLLFYVGIAATIFLLVSRRVKNAARSIVQIFVAMFVVWFAFIAFNTSILYNVPRYYMISGFAISIPAAVLLAHLIRGPGSANVLGRLMLVGFVAIGLLLLYMENTNPLFQERVLVSIARESDEVIHVDPRTFRRSKLLLSMAGLKNGVTSTPPPKGALVMCSSGLLISLRNECERRRNCTANETLLAFDRRDSWTEVRRVQAPRRWIGDLLRTANLQKYIPAQILRKIEKPNDDVILFRVS